MTPDELPADIKKSRLVVAVKEEDTADTDEVVIRALLWRLGEPGHLRGIWDGQQQRIRWDLGDISTLTLESRNKVWWPAVREAKSRGPKPGTTSIFRTFEEFEQACRELVTAEGWRITTVNDPSDMRAKYWREIVAGRVSLATLAHLLGLSREALIDTHNRFKLSQAFDWRTWKRQLAEWAKESDGRRK